MSLEDAYIINLLSQNHKQYDRNLRQKLCANCRSRYYWIPSFFHAKFAQIISRSKTTFALWVFGAFAILYGIRHIVYVTENGASHMTLDIILSILLIILGIFIFKIRFDLAAMRKRSIKE